MQIALSFKQLSGKKFACLSGNLAADASELLCASVLSGLGLSLPCEVDLSGIETVSSEGLDLLANLKKGGVVSRFVRHSAVVLEAIALIEKPSAHLA